MYVLRQFLTRLIEAERRSAGHEIRGKVKQVDTSKAKARIVIGTDEDGEEVLSPWLPYQQINGAFKFHQPPVEGQTMRVNTASGDLEQGVLSPLTWSEGNESPSTDAQTNVMTFGNVKVTVGTSSIVLEIGGTKWEFSAAGETQTGGKKSHDGHNVGKDHKHTEVLKGGDVTGPPTSG